MLHGVNFYLIIFEEEEEPMCAHAFCLGYVHTSIHSNMNMRSLMNLGV